MESISVFEIIKVGIGPSSSHTMGPWNAAEMFLEEIKKFQSLQNVKEIYVTENGYSSTDELTADNHIYDTDRIMFLRSYLSQLQKATAEGVPVKGYFYWSLMDNFEWASGFGIRFGLYYMDYKTLKRIPKLSAEYFKAVAQANAVM